MSGEEGLVPEPAPSLDELAATDAALDQFGALTWGDDGPVDAPAPAPRRGGDRVALAAADPVLALLGSLRADVEPEPAPALAPVVPLRPRLARTRRLAVGGAVLGAVLSVSGVAAAAGVAHPGGTLFGLHRALYGQSRTEAAESTLLDELARARHALRAGDRRAAEEHLRTAGSLLEGVATDRREALSGRLAALQPQVAPTATPASPATAEVDEPAASPTTRPVPAGTAGADADGESGSTPAPRPASTTAGDEGDSQDERPDPAPTHARRGHRTGRPAPRRSHGNADQGTSAGEERATTSEPTSTPTPETGDGMAPSATAVPLPE